MREIDASQITAAVRVLVIEAAHHLEPDILEALLEAHDRETFSLSKNVLDLLIKNCDIASRELIPACQDTGNSVIFVKLGQEVHLKGDFNQAIQNGVEQGYRDGFLRKSLCDVVTRENPGNSVAAVIHLELVRGDKIELSFLLKGCSSENASGLKMLPPAAGIAGAIDFVVETVVEAGPNPCPPLIIGVGLGGSFEKAALMAKEVLLRPLDKANQDEKLAEIEQEILERINLTGTGVQGLGGCNTALAVQVASYPTHSASLPVAVNIQCHSHRHKTIVL